MTEEERQATLGSLQRGAIALRDALKGVNDELARRIPTPGRWSILQCVEHIAIGEDFLYGSITQAKDASAPLLNAVREARIRVGGIDRSKAWDSPEGIRPRGRFCSLEKALEHFEASRQRTLEYADVHLKRNLRCLVTAHPLFGAVNVYEVLLLMAVHVGRHIGQIEEIRAKSS